MSLALYLHNFRVAFLTKNTFFPFGPFWSLAVEEHFYLLWPLAICALRERTHMGLCLAVAAFSFLLRVAVVLAVDATENSRLRRVLESKSLRAINKYSYAIYVFHVLDLGSGQRLLPPLSQALGYIAGPVATVWVLAASSRRPGSAIICTKNTSCD